MRGIQIFLSALMLAYLAAAQDTTTTPPSSTPDSNLGQQNSEVSSLNTNTASISQISKSSSTAPQSTGAMTKTTLSINISSYMTAPISTASPSSNSNPDIFDPSVASTSASPSFNRRNLIIVLSTVLGSLGLLIIALCLFLLYRYSRGRTPFVRRGVSPINDDEIASWRGNNGRGGMEKQQTDNSPQIRETYLTTPSPGWTWTASPASSRLTPYYPSGYSVPDTPSVMFAQAPNARVGLTDETIPGADPFVKRHTSRLSKAPPGHSRNKSRRSSMSNRSIWSFKSGHGELKSNDRVATWYDPDDEVGRELDGSTPSLHGDNTPTPSGGLSPRPKSQMRPWEFRKEDEIGLAIS